MMILRPLPALAALGLAALLGGGCVTTYDVQFETRFTEPEDVLVAFSNGTSREEVIGRIAPGETLEHTVTVREGQLPGRVTWYAGGFSQAVRIDADTPDGPIRLVVGPPATWGTFGNAPQEPPQGPPNPPAAMPPADESDDATPQ